MKLVSVFDTSIESAARALEQRLKKHRSVRRVSCDGDTIIVEIEDNGSLALIPQEWRGHPVQTIDSD